MFSINKYCRNFKPGIPLSKDFRNEAIQMAATRLISEIHERYRMYRFRTSNVWLPSLSCLRPVRTCFTVTCPRLDENDGKRILKYISYLQSKEQSSLVIQSLVMSIDLHRNGKTSFYTNLKKILDYYNIPFNFKR